MTEGFATQPAQTGALGLLAMHAPLEVTERLPANDLLIGTPNSDVRSVNRGCGFRNEFGETRMHALLSARRWRAVIGLYAFGSDAAEVFRDPDGKNHARNAREARKARKARATGRRAGESKRGNQ